MTAFIEWRGTCLYIRAMSKSRTLQQKLAAVRDSDATWKARYDTLVASLVAAGVGADALKAGEDCPEFVLANAEGRLVSLSTLLAKGPIVLSFYRGKWCPYCVTELDALRGAASDIAALGATLVAVTAEDRGGALAAKRERRLEFEILCDPENGLGLMFGLIFRVAPDFRDTYRGINVDFPLIYGNQSWFLPVPATYVISRSGGIHHAYVNPDFRERLDPVEILSILKSLAASRETE
jgi:peroxiredoxin